MGKKFLSIILAFTMVLSLNIPAFAAENETTATNSPRLVSYADMPEEYKQVISSDAVIFQNADGSYDIFQDDPVLTPAKARATNRYAPNGGSYTDLENGWIPSLTCVVYMTYLPRDNVDTWISVHNDGMNDYIIGLIASLGLSKLDQIAAKVLTKYGINNSRVYSSWTGSYVPYYPYDGDATWHPGDYYVMP